MPDHDAHDPWASLAESLGATPAADPTPRQPAAQRPPQEVSARPKQPPKAKPAVASNDWDQLASELGVAGSPEPSPEPRPAPRSAARAADEGHDRLGSERPLADRPQMDRGGADDREPRRGRRGDGGGRREPRPPRFSDDRPPREHRTAREDRGPSEPQGSSDERGEGHDVRDTAASIGADTDRPRREGEEAGDDAGERGGRRRRRGRRGGRGRGRREGDRSDRPDATAPHSGEPGAAMPVRTREGAENDAWDDDEIRRADDGGPTADRQPGEAGLSGERTESRTDREDGGDDSRPRRRRRRGRRGGRGRLREAEGGEARSTGPSDGSPRESSASDEHDDEPVPTSYGMRPRASDAPRGDAPRGDRPAESREGSDGGSEEGRGRRRRRRRGGEGRSRGEAREGSGRESSQPRQRSRSGRRSSGESRSSSFTRGRRDDFAPVAGRHDDDDEGLEFLGVEEASQEASRRQRAADNEDILVESGLNTVLDVPSWVEAIGIVIAGNLDARNKGRSNGGR